jgi:hypothetical protein
MKEYKQKHKWSGLDHRKKYLQAVQLNYKVYTSEVGTSVQTLD